jgi:hypothetical protein
VLEAAGHRVIHRGDDVGIVHQPDARTR